MIAYQEESVGEEDVEEHEDGSQRPEMQEAKEDSSDDPDLSAIAPCAEEGKGRESVPDKFVSPISDQFDAARSAPFHIEEITSEFDCAEFTDHDCHRFR